MEEQMPNTKPKIHGGRILSGFILILTGSVIFAQKLGVEFPGWLFTWPMLLIVLGFYVGAKHNFRRPGWVILVGTGVAFLLARMYPDLQLSQFILPTLLILAGVLVMFKPYRRHSWHRKHCGEDERDWSAYTETNENKIEVTVVMSGVRKIVLSKDFQGGEISCIFGGAEVNLTQADFNGTVILEVNNIFGGTKLIVPADWEVVSEATAILGGIEDKRPVMPGGARSSGKVLIIKGACVFGGMEIRSY